MQSLPTTEQDLRPQECGARPRELPSSPPRHLGARFGPRHCVLLGAGVVWSAQCAAATQGLPTGASKEREPGASRRNVFLLLLLLGKPVCCPLVLCGRGELACRPGFQGRQQSSLPQPGGALGTHLFPYCLISRHLL